MTLASFRLQLAYVFITMAMFAALLVLNAWLFASLEFVPGINWVYLPAGMRLLCPLLFGEAGVVGLLLVSWAASFLYFFPGQFERPFWGGLIATAAPYLVYCAGRHAWGLDVSLANLTPRRLLWLCLGCSVASPLLHHVYFALHGDTDLLRSFVAMFVGDLNGTLIVLYGVKALLSLAPRRAA
ncbi:hypothetical protein LZ009_08360 [Ramlibacter sp. XY19]|uniref:hypothetical protein n=1 Tax=Ramlibacter paludis TaxID=2908000 RepID=UPI0023DB68AC|nr:hypothetical protein [Ramlibacter paludis]MCG2592795.1 hypothetical protein [Ramlibacter paludis]